MQKCIIQGYKSFKKLSFLYCFRHWVDTWRFSVIKYTPNFVELNKIMLFIE